jgi:hypothetical protein
MNYALTLLAALLLTPLGALWAETAQGAKRDADTLLCFRLKLAVEYPFILDSGGEKS